MDAAPESSKPRRSRLRTVLVRWPTYVFLACVALIAGVYLWEFAAGLPLRATGDPLFDTYARAVRNRQAWRLFRGGGMHPATLPDSQLARWEQRFGDDPRYWELRWFCAEHGDKRPVIPGLEDYSGDRQPDDAGLAYLQRAVELGGSIAAHWILHDKQSRRRDTELDQLKPTPESGQEGLRQRRIELMASNEAADLSELETALKAHPNSAWAHYNLARWHFEMGDWDAALPLLEAGNAAQDHMLPLLFPYSFVDEQLAAGVTPGSSRIAGAVLEVETRFTPINYIKWKEVGKELSGGVLMSGDLELWQPYHEFVCLLGKHSGGDALAVSSSAILVRVLPELLLVEDDLGFDRQQREALLVILNRSELIRRKLHAHSAASLALNPTLTILRGQGAVLENGVSGLRRQITSWSRIELCSGSCCLADHLPHL